MAAAVIAAMILTLLMPDEVASGPAWVLVILEGGLLIALIVGDPRAIDRRSRGLRTLSTALVAVLVLGAMWATGHLIAELIDGGASTDSAGALLAAGSIVWAYTDLAFALLYWELDGGGAAARAHQLRPHPDLAFPQQLNSELALEDWRPQFVDYLYLGITNATALSPTDVMPLTPWAKLAMAVQSVASLAILALVIARAVNVFS
jgi:hypothetical protein